MGRAMKVATVFGLAGGSGKTCYVAGAPTHAAVRLLGQAAKTLHKLANAHKGSGLDRRALRTAKSKGDPIEKKIEGAMAMLLDELSMVPPDVYHAGTFRLAMTRQERWRLEMVRYLEQWFGNVPIGVQLADFLQLRPTACLSLCEWQDAQRATDAAVAPESDQEAEAGVEEVAAEHTSNASELGRLAFKSSLQRVVHFTSHHP